MKLFKKKAKAKTNEVYTDLEPGQDWTIGLSKWKFAFQRGWIVPYILFLFFSIYVVPFNWQELVDANGPWMPWALEGFFIGIMILIVFKRVQHWNDLKNGRSR